MATTLLLVRHASHDRVHDTLCGRMADVHLSERGRQEAAALAPRLGSCAGAVFRTSPQPRAAETAGILAAGVPVSPEPALDEIDFAGWTGRSFASLHDDPLWRQWNLSRGEGQVPGGESMAGVQARAMGWVETLAERHPDTTIVAVSHGDVLKSIVCGLLGLSLDQHARFDIAPASVSRVVLWRGGGKVLSMNEGHAA